MQELACLLVTCEMRWDRSLGMVWNLYVFLVELRGACGGVMQIGDWSAVC